MRIGDTVIILKIKTKGIVKDVSGKHEIALISNATDCWWYAFHELKIIK